MISSSALRDAVSARDNSLTATVSPYIGFDLFVAQPGQLAVRQFGKRRPPDRHALLERARRILADELLFEALAEEYGLSPEDIGREFSTGRERFRVAGIDPRRPKYPISATRIPDGKGYKFTAENVVLLLRAAMKDVSPTSP